MAETNPTQQRVDRLVQIAGPIAGGVATHRVPTEKDISVIVDMSAQLLEKLEEKARVMSTSGDEGYAPPKPRSHPNLSS